MSDGADDVVLIEACADDALLLTLAHSPGEAATQRVLSAWRSLCEQRPPWLVWAQPAYTSLQVVHRADADLDEVVATLKALPRAGGLSQVRTHELPVRYGDADGPDLNDVARHCHLSPDEVIGRHADRAYRCAFVGFTPGFPYLLGLDDALPMPRLAVPRPKVPAGSVAIGGHQTGVYPCESPGGWRLIGRLQLTLAPDWIEPGDLVVFRRVP